MFPNLSDLIFVYLVTDVNLFENLDHETDIHTWRNISTDVFSRRVEKIYSLNISQNGPEPGLALVSGDWPACHLTL